MSLLKLTALDPEDLSVFSAHLQDAVLKVGDISYLPGQKKFALVLNRFAWGDIREGARKTYERRCSGLQFARVLTVRSSRIKQDRKEGVLSLLSIGFEPGEAPSGTVVMFFSGGGTIRLSVECIEAQLEDLGPAWETPHLPSHDRERTGS